MRRPILTLALAFALPLGACHRAGAQAEPDPAAAAAEAARGDAFLAKNAHAPGVVALPSGLQYKVVKSGPPTGLHPKPGDEIRVHYEGALVDGTVFDSTLQSGQPAVMTLGGLVPGWMEALPMMRPGDEWILYVPAKLGYGDRGAGGVIPPGATLVFKLQLLGVLPQSPTALG
jgi:FKBP-type peptidyl-prolyl cis-trans isomerase FklB